MALSRQQRFILLAVQQLSRETWHVEGSRVPAGVSPTLTAGTEASATRRASLARAYARLEAHGLIERLGPLDVTTGELAPWRGQTFFLRLTPPGLQAAELAAVADRLNRQAMIFTLNRRLCQYQPMTQKRSEAPLANPITALRNRLGWSAARFALALGCSASTLAGAERGGVENPEAVWRGWEGLQLTKLLDLPNLHQVKLQYARWRAAELERAGSELREALA